MTGDKGIESLVEVENNEEESWGIEGCNFTNSDGKDLIGETKWTWRGTCCAMYPTCDSIQMQSGVRAICFYSLTLKKYIDLWRMRGLAGA